MTPLDEAIARGLEELQRQLQMALVSMLGVKMMNFVKKSGSGDCPLKTVSGTEVCNIRESVDSLCMNGVDVQYMQYVSKTSPQIC